jgi:hypothetical protein
MILPGEQGFSPEASMTTLGGIISKKATKATVRHSVHGVASKAQRKPLRSASLLAIGGAVGATAGWLAGRKTASQASQAPGQSSP